MYSLIRRLLFHLDAETAHEWTAGQMMALQEIPLALRMIERFTRPPASAARELFGLRFPSPIGIAAGFDKNAQLIPMLAALGFGFIEVGTVTLYPQAGNPKPRLFRYPAERALINRMGFNNDGVEAAIERVRATKVTAPIFINVGKNREVDNYAECYEKAAPYADAVVLNLSSPNTPGLRDFQRPEQMERLLRSISKRGPLIVKIAPDLDDAQIGEICDVCVRLADGMTCTNTTTDRLPGMNEAGGLSGGPLMNKSTEVLRKVREHAGSTYPLIGVGGIFTSEDVRAKMAAGASLVQIYTSFIYEGPLLPRRLAQGVG